MVELTGHDCDECGGRPLLHALFPRRAEDVTDRLIRSQVLPRVERGTHLRQVFNEY